MSYVSVFMGLELLKYGEIPISSELVSLLIFISNNVKTISAGWVRLYNQDWELFFQLWHDIDTACINRNLVLKAKLCLDRLQHHQNSWFCLIADVLSILELNLELPWFFYKHKMSALCTDWCVYTKCDAKGWPSQQVGPQVVHSGNIGMTKLDEDVGISKFDLPFGRVTLYLDLL